MDAKARQAKARPKDLPDDLIWPTNEEEEAIRRGIAQDPNNPELTDEFWERAVPASAIMPPDFIAERAAELRQARRPQKAPTKEMIAIRLDRDLLERLRAEGPGWQRRVNALLRAAVLGEG